MLGSTFWAESCPLPPACQRQRQAGGAPGGEDDSGAQGRALVTPRPSTCWSLAPPFLSFQHHCSHLHFSAGTGHRVPPFHSQFKPQTAVSPFLTVLPAGAYKTSCRITASAPQGLAALSRTGGSLGHRLPELRGRGVLET